MKPLFLRLTLLSLPLMACAAVSQVSTPTPQQIPVTVEVTRQVIVTQEVIVQVPVEVTSTPTPEPTPVVNLAPFYNANSGVKMAYPVGWFTFSSSLDGAGHLLAFAPDPALIPADLENIENISTPPNRVAMVWVLDADTPDKAEMLAINPLTMLTGFIGDVEPGVFYSLLEPVLVNGHFATKTAYLMTDDTGPEIAMTFAIVVEVESLILFFAGLRPEVYKHSEPIFDTMIRSIRLNSP